MDAVIDFVRTEPAGKNKVFGYLMNRKIIQARSCYLHYGFKETSEVIEDEIVAIYDLTIQRIRSKHEYL